MTVEEAFLAALGVIAIVLLFLGLAQALEGDPRARRRARRQHLARRAPSRAGVEPGAPRSRPARHAEPSADAAAAEMSAGLVDVVSSPARVTDAEAGAWRESVATHIRRREFVEARRLIDPALASGDVSVGTAGFLLEVCSTAIARDLWRLRRALRRGAGDEAPLGMALEATRALLESEPGAAAPADQRRRVGGRLWRGHTRLGLRRWRAGDFETAVEALFQALSVPGIDERRRRLARDLLVRTLEDMAGQSLELIPQLLGDGDRAAALEQAQRVLGHIRRAREDGIPAEDLAVAASRARQLLEHIEHTSVQ